jgi:hypothetical protein
MKTIKDKKYCIYKKNLYTYLSFLYLIFWTTHQIWKYMNFHCKIFLNLYSSNILYAHVWYTMQQITHSFQFYLTKMSLYKHRAILG